MRVAELARPHGGVMAARALDEAAVNHYGLVLVRTEQRREIGFRLAGRFLGISSIHARHREKEVLRARDVFLAVARIVRHGIDEDHGLSVGHHLLQFGRGQQLVAAGLGVAGQSDGVDFARGFDFELGIEEPIFSAGDRVTVSKPYVVERVGTVTAVREVER